MQVKRTSFLLATTFPQLPPQKKHERSLDHTQGQTLVEIWETRIEEPQERWNTPFRKKWFMKFH